MFEKLDKRPWETAIRITTDSITPLFHNSLRSWIHFQSVKGDFPGHLFQRQINDVRSFKYLLNLRSFLSITSHFKISKITIMLEKKPFYF